MLHVEDYLENGSSSIKDLKYIKRRNGYCQELLVHLWFNMFKVDTASHLPTPNGVLSSPKSNQSVITLC